MSLLLKPVEPARGARWVGDAFRLFARRPLPFTLMFALFLFAALLAVLVPLLGGLLQMAMLPLLSLGFMVASRSALLDGPIHPRQFIEPLQTDAVRRRALLQLCIGYGVGAFLILVLCDWVSDSALQRLQTLMASGEPSQVELDALLAEPGLSAALLLGGVLGTALSVPFWHAPALVYWGAQGAGQALFSSALAVWRAKGAFFLYLMTWVGLVIMFALGSAVLLSLLGVPQLVGVVSLPGGLMFSTVFYVSLIFTFNDSFGSDAMRP